MAGSDGLARAAKRSIDVVLAAALLLLCAPVMFLAGLAIMIVDGRPVVYVQERDGLRGRPFRLFKLRTMQRDADHRLDDLLRSDPAAASEWNTYLRLADDPRMIPVIGRLLRSWSIDELPQLLNVISGDMSLVGPRPIPSALIGYLPTDFLEDRRQVPPGLTGLWQVAGRSVNDLDELRQLDNEYLRKRSLTLDLRILARTPVAVLTRTGAG